MSTTTKTTTKPTTKVSTTKPTKIVNIEPYADLKAIGELIRWWDVGPLYSIGGESQSGKTTLAIQLAAEYSHKTGKPFLLFDTEGGGDKFLEHWMPIHQKKYPKARGMTISCRTWQKVLAKHGLKILSEISDKGKMKIIMKEIIEESELKKYVEKHNIGCIIYDSFTMPMQAFGNSQENFPPRNSVQQMWLHAAIDIADEYQVLIMITNHMTSNPTNPYARPELAGGKAVHHNCKVQFYLKRWEARGIQKYRSIKLDRYYDIAKGDKETIVEFTDDGYVDRTLDDLNSNRGVGAKKKSS